MSGTYCCDLWADKSGIFGQTVLGALLGTFEPSHGVEDEPVCEEEEVEA